MRLITCSLLALLLATPAVAQDKGIAQIVAETPNFQTLYACIEAADLNDAFDEGGPYTVFAPNDDAFAKLPEGTLERLLEDEEELARILKHHIVPSKVSAADAKEAAGSEVKTLLEGSPLAVSVQGDTVMVGTARVIKADVSASNGVIHVIDTVLIPETR